MRLPEIVDVVRRMPTRTGSWLCAGHEADVVQVVWEDGRL
jgi:hypothetical protein